MSGAHRDIGVMGFARAPLSPMDQKTFPGVLLDDANPATVICGALHTQDPASGLTGHLPHAGPRSPVASPHSSWGHRGRATWGLSNVPGQHRSSAGARGRPGLPDPMPTPLSSVAMETRRCSQSIWTLDPSSVIFQPSRRPRRPSLSCARGGKSLVLLSPPRSPELHGHRIPADHAQFWRSTEDGQLRAAVLGEGSLGQVGCRLIVEKAAWGRKTASPHLAWTAERRPLFHGEELEARHHVRCWGTKVSDGGAGFKGPTAAWEDVSAGTTGHREGGLGKGAGRDCRQSCEQTELQGHQRVTAGDRKCLLCLGQEPGHWMRCLSRAASGRGGCGHRSRGPHRLCRPWEDLNQEFQSSLLQKIPSRGCVRELRWRGPGLGVGGVCGPWASRRVV